MTGLSLLNGADRSPNETFVQIPCRAWRIEADMLRRVLRDTDREMHDHFLLFAQAFCGADGAERAREWPPAPSGSDWRAGS